VVGGEFFVMDYLMVFKPLTSRSLALRTGELHHCTMLVEKEASQPGGGAGGLLSLHLTPRPVRDGAASGG
jgi:hypothetical protein